MIDYTSLYDKPTLSDVMPELTEEQMMQFVEALDVDPLNTIEPEPVAPPPVTPVNDVNLTLLASRVRELTGALRRVVTACTPYSDQGRAPWYLDAQNALKRRSRDEG